MRRCAVLKMTPRGRGMTAQGYNYATFPSDDDVAYFGRFQEHLKVGEPAPDAELLDLESGEMVRLSEITRDGLTILEFGSLT